MIEDGPGGMPADAAAAEAGASEFEPVLSQAEVDAIAGLRDEAAAQRGWRDVAGAGEPGRPALPVLDAVLDRFLRRCGPALSLRLGGDVVMARLSARTLRFADYVASLPMPTDAFAFRAEGWGGEGLVALGGGFAPLALDALLGGGGGRRRPALRPATAIETGILSRLVALLLAEAGGAFSEIAPVGFAPAGPIERLDACTVAGEGEEVLSLAFEIGLGGAFATFDLVLSASTLAPVRPLLAGRFTGEKLGRDDLWATHLATEMWQAPIEAEVVLHEGRFPIGRILDLAIGETLVFDVKPADLVELRAGPLLLSRGRMGRVDGRIALQLAEPLRPAGSQSPGRPS